MPKPTYNKPPLTLEDQVIQLKKRGMIIDDESACKKTLSNISYYRLSAYSHPFRMRNNSQVLSNFIDGVNWNTIIKLYEFDKKLRLLVMDAIEVIEIAVRTQITYNFSCQYGTFGYLNTNNFHHKFSHSDWLGKITSEVNRSKDTFVMHFKNEYGDDNLPIWMMTEVISLGNLSKFYQGLKNQDKKSIANNFNVPYQRLKEWLHVLTYVRNICAHHSRLYNRELTIQPSKVKKKEKEWNPPITPNRNKVFYVLLMLRHLMASLNSDSDWKKKIEELIDDNFCSKECKVLTMMGFSSQWKKHPKWK